MAMHKHDFAFYRPRLDDFLLRQPGLLGRSRGRPDFSCTYFALSPRLKTFSGTVAPYGPELEKNLRTSFFLSLRRCLHHRISPPPPSGVPILSPPLGLAISPPFFSPAFLSAAASALSSSSPFSSAVLLFADVALVRGRTGKVGRRRREGGRDLKWKSFSSSSDRLIGLSRGGRGHKQVLQDSLLSVPMINEKTLCQDKLV